MTKIWFISDTHNRHGELIIPEVDLVVHCGDFSNHPDIRVNTAETFQFLEFYKEIPVTKIVVPGNHDVWAGRNIQLFEQTCKDFGIIPLVHNQIEVMGLRIFGSPWTPTFGRGGLWAFNRDRGSIGRKWETIPENTDILLTHGPPKTILDSTKDIDSSKIISVGCSALNKRVKEVKPRIHAFGHIHSSKYADNFGMYDNGETKFINCSCQCDNLFNKGWIADV